jgi:hypothetical protein
MPSNKDTYLYSESLEAKKSIVISLTENLYRENLK